MDTNRWPRLVLLLIAAVASGVLLVRSNEEAPTIKRKPELGIGYYMQQAELTRTGETGQVLYKVQTDRATQITDDGIIELDGVQVSYDPLAEVPWDMRADKGYLLSEQNIIQLSGDVIAETRGEPQAPVRISTDYLEMNTETYIADTDRDVAIDYTNNKIFATGLRVFLKEERLQLISDVNGLFIP